MKSWKTFNNRVVVNTSPLITLCKSDQEWLLPELFSEIVIPSQVYDEIAMGGVDDPASQKIGQLQWLRLEHSVNLSHIVQSWDLGVGETAVISHVLSNQEHIAIIDDSAARRAASSLQLKVIGTLGVIVEAKRRGIINAIAPGLKALKDSGLWVSDELIIRLVQNEDK